MNPKTAHDLRAEYPPKLIDKWLEAGYRAWLKRQTPKSTSAETKLNSKLKDLTLIEYQALKTKLRKSLRK